MILEVDEHQHTGRDPSCDVRRDFDTLASVMLGSGDKLRVLRYNPDSYKVAGVTQPTTRPQREAMLLQVLESLEVEPDVPFIRLFLYYSREAHNSTLPLIAAAWTPEVRAVSRCLA